MKPILIVGAGPTGLAAALFLHERGVRVRVIDRAAMPSQQSKALAINRRSLELLRRTGVSSSLTEIHAARADRRVQMRRIAGEECRALLPRGGHAMAHGEIRGPQGFAGMAACRKIPEQFASIRYHAPHIALDSQQKLEPVCEQANVRFVSRQRRSQA